MANGDPRRNPAGATRQARRPPSSTQPCDNSPTHHAPPPTSRHVPPPPALTPAVAVAVAAAPSPVARGASLSAGRLALAPAAAGPCAPQCAHTAAVEASCPADEMCPALCELPAWNALLACVWCVRDARLSPLPPAAVVGGYVDAVLLDCAALGAPLSVDAQLAAALARVGSREAALYAELAAGLLAEPAAAGVGETANFTLGS
ncbi:hypothetical protein Q8F55_001747 [Vanrija albida]|uniref:Uncharacterized protein n=1 Tax=Vanrija albida TaxID=181172 RepID=A0ABR3Q7V4_9TREE